MSMGSHSFLDQEIITRFKLFQDLRSREEDERILLIVSGRVWDETLLFLEGLIPVEEQELVRSVLQNIATEDMLLEVFKTYIDGDMLPWRLRTRLIAFLDNLLIQSTKTS